MGITGDRVECIFSRHVRTEMEAWLYLLLVGAFATSSDLVELPKFGEPIINITAPVGRDTTLTCVVNDLSTYKVAWLRVDTQTILTIHSHVITKNQRIGVSHTDHRTWILHIKDVRESDRGWYMCQINTDPMKSQVGFLDVVVPPDILDYPSSSDMVVQEGSNVTLRCAASGSPAPNITWKRDNNELISLGNGIEVPSTEGPVLNFTRINRTQMGTYYCLASNGIPPSKSKRIIVGVNFPPMIWIQNQLIGAYESQQLTLECVSEAYPPSMNYWLKDGVVMQGGTRSIHKYRTHMKLTIKSVGPDDFGAYQCIAKNTIAQTDGSIKVYALDDSDRPRTTRAPKYKYKNRKASMQRGLISLKNNTGSLINSTYLDSNELEPFSSYDDDDVNKSNSINISISVLVSFCLISFCT